MSYSAATILALAASCAPGVAPQTVAAIIRTESRGQPFALNVNGARQPAQQTNAADAGAVARHYIAADYSVDLGLGQINSRNMRWLGLTWDTVFDPCTNVAALGRVLTANYSAARPGRDPQHALRVALSMYNTGSPSRGFRNGYVAKVVANAGVVDGGLSGTAEFSASTSAAPENPGITMNLASQNMGVQMLPVPARQEPPPSWNVFERAAFERQSRLLTAEQQAEQERARS